MVDSETSSGEKGQDDEETQEIEDVAMLCLIAIEEGECSNGKEAKENNQDEVTLTSST